MIGASYFVGIVGRETRRPQWCVAARGIRIDAPISYTSPLVEHYNIILGITHYRHNIYIPLVHYQIRGRLTTELGFCLYLLTPTLFVA